MKKETVNVNAAEIVMKTTKPNETLLDDLLRRVLRCLLVLIPLLIIIEQTDGLFYWVTGMTTSVLVATIVIQTTPVGDTHAN